jgi:ech hydrogenase subunit A
LIEITDKMNYDMLMKEAPVSAILFVLILLPMIAGLAAFVFRADIARKSIILSISWLLTIAALLLFGRGVIEQKSILYTPQLLPWNEIITALDFLLLAGFILAGVMLRSVLISALAVAQIAFMVWLEYGMKATGEHLQPIFIDWLSVVMVLIVSIIGSIVAVFAIPYMREHEEHPKLQKSKQPQFFMILLLFLGAMNGLVLSSNLIWVYFFWEITTLCSFLMIGHDGTEVANQNAARALWMNLLGGLAFIIGMTLLRGNGIPLDIRTILVNVTSAHSLNNSAYISLLLLPMAFFCFAGFTKAAQMPFQSWLLGAMVAPTPVSALLHSSTMVKAGVYIIVRFAPAFQGTGLSHMVAIAGSFTFCAGALLAIGQSNAKKVLAYSTISNLGLIIACAGLDTPLALSAAVMLIIFHAISKGLLFMSTGVVEHSIHSRDIEDMQGLWNRMPVISFLMLVGILSMLLPPFGVLISKLAAIEASARVPVAMVMMVIGSTLTVVFWTKWMGRMLTTEPGLNGRHPEHIQSLYYVPLFLLTAGAVVLSFLVGPVLNHLLLPAVAQYYSVPLASIHASILHAPWMIIFLVFIIAVFAPILFMHLKKEEIRPVYMCGEQTENAGISSFRTAAEAKQELSLRGYYFDQFVGEQLHTKWITEASCVLIIFLFGAVYLWK